MLFENYLRVFFRTNDDQNYAVIAWQFIMNQYSSSAVHLQLWRNVLFWNYLSSFFENNGSRILRIVFNVKWNKSVVSSATTKAYMFGKTILVHCLGTMVNTFGTTCIVKIPFMFAGRTDAIVEYGYRHCFLYCGRRSKNNEKNLRWIQ